MAGATSDPAVTEQPELMLEEIREANKPGLWILLVLGALCLVIAYVVGLKGIFDGSWR